MGTHYTIIGWGVTVHTPPPDEDDYWPDLLHDVTNGRICEQYQSESYLIIPLAVTDDAIRGRQIPLDFTYQSMTFRDIEQFVEPFLDEAKTLWDAAAARAAEMGVVFDEPALVIADDYT